MNSSVRINKYISEKGICSRREADRLIENGRVFINGVRARLGDHAKPGDRVMVNGIKLDRVEEKALIIIALNKPVGIVSTAERTTKDNIIDFVNYSERIFPVGRLDKDSQGLILLTNNGDIVNKILRAGNNHEKEYLVTVDKPITDEFLSGMAGGVPILGEVTKKCKVTKESAFVFRIVLIQGLNRQIRRMCTHFGYEVEKLERIRVMNIGLKGLPLGEWRELEPRELSMIMDAIADSSSDPATRKPDQKKRTGPSKRSGTPPGKGFKEKGTKPDASERGKKSFRTASKEPPGKTTLKPGKKSTPRRKNSGRKSTGK